MAGESLLLDVPDAVGSSQQVDWERVRSAARPDQRRSLDSLHALWRMFAAGSPRAPGRPHTAVFGDPTGPAFARFALGASVALVAPPAMLSVFAPSSEAATKAPSSDTV